ncbi:MAG: response regulator [Chloroflexi bacterium]|nr:response regulator [Chloroflexota bacterium]
MLSLWLEGANYEVVTAGDGARALKLMRELKPSLVLLDIMMPVVDGWEVIRQSRRDLDLRHVPILLTSALPGGVNTPSDTIDWLRKPFTGSQLLAKVSQLLSEARARDEGA